MNYKKIVASDIDGTILWQWDQICDLNKELILKFQEKTNNAFTLLTGRHYFLAEFLTNDLDIKLPIVCSNGSSVIDPITHKYIAKNHFNKEEASKIFNKFLNTNIEFSVVNDFTMHSLKTNSSLLKFINKENKINYSTLPNEQIFYQYDDLKALTEKCFEVEPEVVSVIIDCKNIKEKEKAYKLLNNLEVEIMEFFYNDEYKLEVYKKDVDKSWGLKKLLEHLMLTKDDVYFFGDEHNDFPVFRQFPNCFSPSNANEEIKKLAKEILDSVKEAGVGKKINQLIDLF